MRKAARVELFVFCLLSSLFFAGCANSLRRSGEPTETFCRFDRLGRATANYSDPLVRSAREALAATKDFQSLSVSKERLSLAGGKSGRMEDDFLRVLCSEYRDNEPQLRGLLESYRDIYVVRNGEQKYNRSLPLWSQLTAEGYREIVFLMKNLASFRLAAQSAQIAPSLPPLSVCETKYIFRDYLASYRQILTVDDFHSYERGREQFVKNALASGECTNDDLETVYFFRGDGAISPTFLEPRAMYSRSALYSSECSPPSGTEALPAGDCADYLRNPFAKRIQFEKEALKSLPELSRQLRTTPSALSPLVFFTADTDGDDAADVLYLDSDTPFGVRLRRTTRALVGATENSTENQDWLRPSLLSLLKEGLETRPESGLVSLKTTDWDGIQRNATPWVVSLFKLMVDRHVHSESSHFISLEKNFISLRHTPWTEAFPYIHFSHPNTFAGFDTKRLRWPRMHWISVYRVNRRLLYSAEQVASGLPVDFKQNWFDSAALDPQTAATVDHKWLQSGYTALEELETLLWLGNVEATSETRLWLKPSGSEMH